jgi:YggT family protein
MFIFGNFLSALANILDMLLSLYMWIVIISALITWVNPDPYNPIVRFLRAVTEPVLRPIRRVIGYGIGIDFSPMVVILIILFVKYFLIASLIDIAVRLR